MPIDSSIVDLVHGVGDGNQTLRLEVTVPCIHAQGTLLVFGFLFFKVFHHQPVLSFVALP